MRPGREDPEWYFVPEGTPGCVALAAPRPKWRPYRTTRGRAFDRPERTTDKGFVFRDGAHLLHVCRRFVERVSPPTEG